MIKPYAEHRENLAKKPKDKWTDIWFDVFYEHICIELDDKPDPQHNHPQLTPDLIEMVCDLVNDGAELLDKAAKWDRAGEFNLNIAGAGIGKTHAMLQEMAAKLSKLTAERDSAVTIAEDLAAHIDDALGYLKTMHESFENHGSEQAIELLTDALEVAKKNSIVPAPATQGDPK